MALSFTARLFMNNRVLRTERILQSLPKCSAYESTKKYVNVMKNINLENTYEGVSELVQFPYKSFHMFPTDCLKTMIEESLNALKEKGKAKHINVYNKTMYSLWNNKIDFDVDFYLNDIVENNLRINSETFDIIIKCYSRQKRIDDIEQVLKKMEKENIVLQNRSLNDVIYAYIVTGQEEKAQAFIKARDIDENNIALMMTKMRAYASLGDTTTLFQLLNNFSDYNKSYLLSDLYQILSKAGVSDVELETLIGMMGTHTIVETIKSLNQDQFYNKGLQILQQNIENIDNKFIYRILMTFNTPTCPLHIYRGVLDLTLSHIYRVRTDCDFFNYMTFDDALSYSLKSSSITTSRALSFSLLNKAIDTKFFGNIHEALKFAQTALLPKVWHYLIQTVLVQGLLEKKLVKDSSELLSIFTHSQYGTLPDVFLYHICRGEFSEVNRLHANFPGQFFGRYAIEMPSIAHNLVTVLGVRNFSQVKQETCKVFTTRFANKMLSVTFVKLLANAAECDAPFDIELKSIKELEVQFSESDIQYLSKLCPQHIETFRLLPVYEPRQIQETSDFNDKSLASSTEDNQESDQHDKETKEF